jgi:hypothetical protein
MVRTKNRKNRKNIKKTKKVYGGEPDVITVNGLYDDTDKDKELVTYFILHSKMNDEQKQKYAEKHKVFIPSNTSILKTLGKMFDINTKRLKKNVDKYFYPANEEVQKKTFTNTYKTIVVHHAEDIQKIQMANKIIGNIKTNDASFKDRLTTKYDGKNINVVVSEYVKFITTNKDLLLADFVKDKTEPVSGFLKEDGERMLKSPVFLKKIGQKYEIFDKWSEMVEKEGGLDKINDKLN